MSDKDTPKWRRYNAEVLDRISFDDKDKKRDIDNTIWEIAKNEVLKDRKFDFSFMDLSEEKRLALLRANVCPHCFYTNDKSAIFCVKCGKRLNSYADIVIVDSDKKNVVKMRKLEYERLKNRPDITQADYQSLLSRPNISQKDFEELKAKANMAIWQQIWDEYGYIPIIIGLLFVLVFFAYGIATAIFSFGMSLGLSWWWCFAISIFTITGLFLYLWKIIFHDE